MTAIQQLSSSQIRLDYPDDDVHRRVSSFLRSRHFPAFRKLDIEVVHGAVTITGVVRSYYEKQVAMKSCQHVPGVLSLIDQISVEEHLASKAEKKPRRRVG